MKLTIGYNSLTSQSINNTVKAWTSGIVLELKSTNVQIQTPSGPKTLILDDKSENTELLATGKKLNFLVKESNGEHIVEKVSINGINKSNRSNALLNSEDIPTTNKMNLKDITYSSILKNRGNENIEIARVGKIFDLNMSINEMSQISKSVDNVIQLSRIDLENIELMVDKTLDKIDINKILNVPIEDLNLVELDSRVIEKFEVMLENEGDKLDFKLLQDNLKVPKEKLVFSIIVLKKLGMEVNLQNLKLVLNHESDNFFNEILSEFSEETKPLIESNQKQLQSKNIDYNKNILKLNLKDTIFDGKVLKNKIENFYKKNIETLSMKIEKNNNSDSKLLDLKFESNLKFQQNLQMNLGIYEVPIELNDSISGELYYKKHITKNSQEKYSVLIKLSTDKIGDVKILCNQIGEYLQVYFLVQDENIKTAILENKVEIRKLLKDSAYNQIEIDCFVDLNKTIIELLVDRNDESGVDLKI